MRYKAMCGLVGRRLFLGSGAAIGLAPSFARADIRGNVVFGKDGWLFAAWEDVRRVNLQKTRQVAQLVGRAVQTLRQSGMEVALSLAPTRARIMSDFLPPTFQPSSDAGRRYALALEELRKSGAVVPDYAALLTTLRTNQQDPVFFKADTHWTAVTAEAAAADLAEAVKQRVALPPSPRPGTRLSTFQPDTRGGDLLQLLPDAEKARFPAERFRIRRAATTTGGSEAGGLLEDDSADVLIVGNSYMQPYFGFPYVLSNRLNRPVGLVWKTARIGPYRTLLDALEGTQFRRQQPRLLVWHLMEGSLDQMPDAANWWESTSVMSPQHFLAELYRLTAR